MTKTRSTITLSVNDFEVLKNEINALFLQQCNFVIFNFQVSKNATNYFESILPNFSRNEANVCPKELWKREKRSGYITFDERTKYVFCCQNFQYLNLPLQVLK